MRGSRRCFGDKAENRCAICNRKFGLARNYPWQTALCSSRCWDGFAARESGDRMRLGAGDPETRFPIGTCSGFPDPPLAADTKR
jgi:hypothetical protein